MSCTQRRRQPWELSGVHRFELRLYRCLGAEPFRRLVFAVESLRHRRDGGRNQNYHLDRLSAAGAEEFTYYLFYHVFLHTASLLLLAPVALYRRLHSPGWGAPDLLLGLMALFNIWCIMLQRYNYLRLLRLRRRGQAVRVRRMDRHLARLLEVLPHSGVRSADLSLAGRVLEDLSQGRDAFLRGEDADGLLRLTELLERADLLPARKSPPEPPAGQPLDALAERCALCLRPYSRLEARVDRLYRRMPLRRGGAPLSRCAVVTEDPRAEAACSRLFARLAPEGAIEVFLLLVRASERQTAGEV